MAYRRKHQITRASTFSVSSHDYRSRCDDSAPASLAAQAIRASSAYRDPPHSSAYGDSGRQRQDDSTQYGYAQNGFWGVLARKAKSILEDDDVAKQFEAPPSKSPKYQMVETPNSGQFHDSYRSSEGSPKTGGPKFQKGLEAITSSLNHIGGSIGNVLEEGLTVVENRTADIISETRKLQLRRKGTTNSIDAAQQEQGTDLFGLHQPKRMTIQADQDTQLKASRDVAMAMAAKAKLLLRELKTVKADLAFTKERCAQLEEENKRLRESRENGDTPEDDDLIRLQLETLLAEKGRLANENSLYARENRFLREIVEYHQLKMQDFVYVDEGQEEVTEVYSIPIPPVAVDVRPVASTEGDAPSPTSGSANADSPRSAALDVRDVSATPTSKASDMAAPESQACSAGSTIGEGEGITRQKSTSSA